MGGSEAAEEVEPSAGKQVECDTHLEVKSSFSEGLRAFVKGAV